MWMNQSTIAIPNWKSQIFISQNLIFRNLDYYVQTHGLRNIEPSTEIFYALYLIK